MQTFEHLMYIIKKWLTCNFEIDEFNVILVAKQHLDVLVNSMESFALNDSL